MFDFFASLPAYALISLAFASILILNRIGVHLGLSIIINSSIIVLFSSFRINVLIHQFSILFKAESLLLLAVITLLLFFTETLKCTGRMERTVDALKNRFSNDRFLLSGLPALIGLLPMPGGALFSAPMIESIDKTNNMENAHKSVINYWFRHIWEFWWPLYPGVILAIQYSGLNAGTFFLIQLPFSVFAIAGGYFFLLKRVNNKNIPSPVKKTDNLAILAAIGPIILLVSITVTGSFVFTSHGITSSLANLYSILIGLIISITFSIGKNKMALKKASFMFLSVNTWKLILLVASVQFFSSVLKMPYKGSDTLITLMRDELTSIGIPFILMIFLIPFISGMVTGIAVGFVGASFPLVIALLGDNPNNNVHLAVVSIAYASGYLGMMLSPLHVCFVVSNDFFKTKFTSAYKFIPGPILSIIIGMLILSSVYYFAFK